MSDRVHLDSVDALRQFRVGMIKFAETCNNAMGDVEGDFSSMLNWLENEQLSHWQTQIRKRADILSKAQEALRHKRIFKDASGRTPQAADEEKAVRLAQARLAEAEEKLLNVKKYTRVLQKEIQAYKGNVQRFLTTLQSDVPHGIATLDKMSQTLEAYVTLKPEDLAPSTSMAGGTEPATRSEAENDADGSSEKPPP